MRKNRVLVLIAALSIACANACVAASFDCAKASARIENAICASPKVSKLDSDLRDVYQTLLAQRADADDIRLAQRTWLNQTRDRCQDETCLVTVYEQRIAALQSAAAQDAPTRDEAENDEPPQSASDNANQVFRATSPDAAVSAPIVGDQSAPTSAPTSSVQPESAASNPTTQSESSKASAPATWVSVTPHGQSWRKVISALAGLLMLGCWVGIAIFAFRKRLKLTHAILLAFGVLIVAGILGGTYGSTEENDFYDAAQQVPVATLFQDLNGLKFGDPPSRLPKDYVVVERTADEREGDRAQEKEGGIPPCKLYRNTKPRPELQGLSVRNVTVCFDDGRLLDVVALMDGSDAFVKLKERVEANQGRSGTKDQVADEGYRWSNSINGVTVETFVQKVANGAVYAVKLVHLHKIKGDTVSAPSSAAPEESGKAQTAASTNGIPACMPTENSKDNGGCYEHRPDAQDEFRVIASVAADMGNVVNLHFSFYNGFKQAIRGATIECRDAANERQMTLVLSFGGRDSPFLGRYLEPNKRDDYPIVNGKEGGRGEFLSLRETPWVEAPTCNTISVMVPSVTELNAIREARTSVDESNRKYFAQKAGENDPIQELKSKFVTMGPRCPQSVRMNAMEALGRIDELSKYEGATRSAAQNLAQQQLLILKSVGCIPR